MAKYKLTNFIKEDEFKFKPTETDAPGMQARPDGYLKEEDKVKENIEKNIQKLIDAGYSESDAEDFADEFEQGGVKVPQRVKDILLKNKEKTEESLDYLHLLKVRAGIIK